MEQPDIIVDGKRLSMYMPWGDLELVTCWPGGTETITFDVARPHDMFRTGAIVEVDYAGERRGCGSLVETPRGEPMRAEGLHRLGEQYTALTVSGLPADGVHAAVDAAIGRGPGRGIPWLRGPDGSTPYDLSPEPLLRGMPRLNANQTHSVSQYLDASAKERGHLWGVDAERFVIMLDWLPPAMHLLPGVDGLSRNANGYASALVARYNSVTTGVYETAVYVDEVATDRWGYAERTLTQLLAEGEPITEAQAKEILAGILTQGRASMGWTKPIEVQYGDVVDDRHQPVDLWDLGRPAQTLTVGGLDEDIADLEGATTALFRIARTRHVGATVLLEPTGLSSPMEDALATAGAA